MPRRRLLRGGLSLGAAAAVGSILTACGDGAGSAGSSGGDVPRHALIAAFPQSEPHIPAGVPSRLPFLVTDREGVPLSRIDGKVRFTISRDGTAVGSVQVAPRADGVPRAYLPVTFTFPKAGIYDLSGAYDGSELTSTVQVVDRSQVGPPVVGDPLPPVHSPTTTDPLGVDPLCTREPPCPLHQVDLHDAVGAGRPVVLAVATPAYCQTAVCGPLLDLVMEATEGRTDLVVIHSEVYRNPTAEADLAKAALAPVPEAYHLTFEPVVFITDRNGVVVARADVTVDRGELKELLALAV